MNLLDEYSLLPEKTQKNYPINTIIEHKKPGQSPVEKFKMSF